MSLELHSCLKTSSADDIRVTVRTVGNVAYTLTLRESDKVARLRTKLYETCDVKHRFKLVVQKTILEDENRLDSYGIQDGSVVQLLFISPEMIGITVHVFKKGVVRLDISDSDTVADLRASLTDKRYFLGSAPLVYDVFFQSEKLLEDLPLHFYGITNNSQVHLKCLDASFKVAIEASGSFKVVDFLEVKGTEHVADVKRRVLRIIVNEEEADLKLDDVVIFHNPKNCRQTYNELDCDRFTLNKYGVEPYDYFVYIVYRAESPCAEIEDARKLRHIHHVTPLESVQSFRLKIQDQLGIPFGKQKLSFHNIENPGFGDKIENFEDIRMHVEKICHM